MTQMDVDLCNVIRPVMTQHLDISSGPVSSKVKLMMNAVDVSRRCVAFAE